MLVKWLSSNEKDNIPAYATHYIGVGGFLHKEFIIYIQLNRGSFKGRYKGNPCCKGKSLDN